MMISRFTKFNFYISFYVIKLFPYKKVHTIFCYVKARFYANEHS